MAVDAVMDSVSVKTTHKEKLAELGVIFCSFSEAVKDYPDLVKRLSLIHIYYYVQYYSGTFQHGGISLEEMIIPLITLTAK